MTQTQNPKIGIIGVGMVGKTLARYFEEYRSHIRGRDLFLYDAAPAKRMADDINAADIVFVCVPTPSGPSGEADLSAVESAFKHLATPKIVVIKSTVPPGTTEAFQKRHPAHKLLFNPENLTERNAWHDFVRPADQIVGFTSQSVDSAHIVLSLLPKAPFMSPWGVGTYKRTAISATEAEIVKYARNVHFARKVNFANALATLAERMGADYENVRLGLSADHRIGDSHLDVTHGGYRGFGGFCLPKDLDAFIAHLAAVGLGASAELLKGEREFNKKILASQGLTIEDVVGHDAEHIERVRRKLHAESPMPTAQSRTPSSPRESRIHESEVI